MVARYRRVVATALIGSTVLGAGLGVALYLSWNPASRDDAGALGVLVSAGLTTLGTLAHAVLATIGSGVALSLVDRGLRHSVRRRVAASALGAFLAVVAGWLIATAVDAGRAPAGAFTFGPTLFIAAGVIAALVTAIASLVLTLVAESRARRTAVTA